MTTCQVDPSIERKSIKGFKFPLGVYPVETMTPMVGYSSEFEPADNAEEMGDWEAWPDQYVFDVVMPTDRVEPFWHQLFAMMPGRIFPIIDYIGHDAYREIDPYMAYEPIGKEKVIDAIRTFRPFFFEDGMVGFGAVSEDPFFYIFVDEHKIVTIRVESQFKARVEKLLAAFDIEPKEEPAGADSAAHEHRAVLLTTPDHPELLNGDEILERMRDAWNLVLNVDPETNVDDEGKELGITLWRCFLRYATDQNPDDQYAEVFLSTDSIRKAEEISQHAIITTIESESEWHDVIIIAVDRFTPEQLKEIFKQDASAKSIDFSVLKEDSVLAVRLIMDKEQP
ncbi:MAG: hypothetical protein P1U42_03070 [Phycisphaerales bacterium]|nr:hypothetical protein [Phycisphaerales bacterium]